jgi:hypothetical protein
LLNAGAKMHRLAAPKRLHRWQQVGASMIAIDTLVHNFLVRTGILARFDADHSYGAACYQAGGCADIMAAVANRIDARQMRWEVESAKVFNSSTARVE